jgi:multiple sugar transport system substrate-binding protein
VGSWYTGSAFADPEKGGQPADFRFGMLRYPLMDGAKAPDTMMSSFPTGYVVLSTSENKDVAKDIFRFWSENPRFGATFTAKTGNPSAIKYTPEDIPEDLRENPYQWYWDELSTVYGDQELFMHGPACGDFNEALTTVLNQGIPLRLYTVDEAIDYLDAHLCTE